MAQKKSEASKSASKLVQNKWLKIIIIVLSIALVISFSFAVIYGMKYSNWKSQMNANSGQPINLFINVEVPDKSLLSSDEIEAAKSASFYAKDLIGYYGKSLGDFMLDHPERYKGTVDPNMGLFVTTVGGVFTNSTVWFWSVYDKNNEQTQTGVSSLFLVNDNIYTIKYEEIN